MHELQRQLDDAKKRYADATKSRMAIYTEAGDIEYWSAHRDLLHAERNLAANECRQFAESIDFPYHWDVGAPMPLLLRDELTAYLSFRLRTKNPDFDGLTVTVVSNVDRVLERRAIVTFQHCIAVSLGSPNDEVHEGHPLFGNGMEAYSAQRVVNSEWKASLEEINSVHRCYDPNYWMQLTHYVFWFHDTTFDCIARGFAVECLDTDTKGILERISKRMTQ